MPVLVGQDERRRTDGWSGSQAGRRHVSVHFVNSLPFIVEPRQPVRGRSARDFSSAEQNSMVENIRVTSVPFRVFVLFVNIRDKARLLPLY